MTERGQPDQTGEENVDWHNVAREFMDRRPELKQMSLDEWLWEHVEYLSPAELREGMAILWHFAGYGGTA